MAIGIVLAGRQRIRAVPLRLGRPVAHRDQEPRLHGARLAMLAPRRGHDGHLRLLQHLG